MPPPKKTTPEKDITARRIVGSQLRQQSIFNNKVKTEQAWLIDELNQLQVSKYACNLLNTV